MSLPRSGFLPQLIRFGATFFIPQKRQDVLAPVTDFAKKVTAIVPTRTPGNDTLGLINSLLEQVEGIQVVVVDDCNPEGSESEKIFEKISQLCWETSQVHLIRTLNHRLKAGAINAGLDFIKTYDLNPDVVLTLDDDVALEPGAISNLVAALYKSEKTGAVCSKVRVKNKNHNLLTRLQGLEYHGFNLAKIGDNGFLYGPLVMQGMLIAFRYQALKEVQGFVTGHLIEDYDITARLKEYGWEVFLDYKAVAWTRVQETVPSLWKQRVRWSYGGLQVLRDFWRLPRTVFQDLIGHGLFVATAALIGLSFVLPYRAIEPNLIILLIGVSLVQFFISFGFQLTTMPLYQDADWIDWLIRILIVPEFLYTNVLSLVMVGSYFFFVYNRVWELLLKKLPQANFVYRSGLGAFQHLGYSVSWGTRQ